MAKKGVKEKGYIPTLAEAMGPEMIININMLIVHNFKHMTQYSSFYIYFDKNIASIS